MGTQSGFGDEHTIAKVLAAISQAAADAGRPPADDVDDGENTRSDSSVSAPE